MVLLVTGMIICYAHRGALGVAAPFMIKELNLSPAVMGVLLSAFFWLYSFMQMPAGWLVDRFGVKKAYAFGFVLWSIASACTGFAGGLAALIILQMMLGVGQAVAFPASARAVANWFQNKERGTVTATYLTGVRLGQALIGFLGAYFLAVYSWKIFVLVISVAPMIWLIPWYKFLGNWDKTSLSPNASGNEIESLSAIKKGASFVEGLALLKDRTVFGIFLGFFAYDYVWFVYTRWLAGYLVIERKLTKPELAFWTSVPFLIMSVIILVSGAASDLLIRRGHSEIKVRKTFIVAGLLVGCLMVPAGMVADKTTALCLLTVSLCGLGICSPNTWTLTQAVCSRTLVGTVSGIQNFGGNLGGIIAPALTGFIAHKTQSFSLAFSICGAILIVGMLSYIFLIGPKTTTEDLKPAPAVA
jgi:MFS transporter, ACS family, D-galactonate transporter